MQAKIDKNAQDILLPQRYKPNSNPKSFSLYLIVRYHMCLCDLNQNTGTIDYVGSVKINNVILNSNG